ncbi:hypothetical protein CALVIDRAFT_524196 [Calocera viscosa TUFC12733]|uniref:Uncharacterized protein n=1 Tax=Calocera viscosa (strain TUFC12733) TaxID=1330018 RepID=A0A167RLI7_CALVF|nr:hypothetical protein CALVIDRAFT_524196 [Calocera viscosa TUFC12733]
MSTLPTTLPQSTAATMTFEVVDGVHWEVTVWTGSPAYPFLIPAHWHEQHDEHITLLRGGLDVCLDGVWERFESTLGKGREIVVRRGVVHEFRGVPGKEMEFRERTVVYLFYSSSESEQGPLKDQPEFKACFFRDLFVQPNPTFLHVMRCFWDGDTYAALPYMPKLVGRVFTAVFAGLAMLLGDRKLLRVEDLRRLE